MAGKFELVISAMDAIVKGTSDGVKLLINIIAMLIVLVALVSLINQGLHFLPDFNGQPITLQGILGVIMAPLESKGSDSIDFSANNE
ncbi:MAG: nucleoside transporter C-terminal domain-containing protein [Pseudomonadota bacterium]